mgnify:CR=1 FL=1
MIRNEDDLIEYLINNIQTKSKNITRTIGDDCAVLKISSKKSLVFTTDTSLEGPHFTKEYSPADIGYKCLASNLSDIAAMGCKPRYFLMAITIPNLNNDWVKNFYKGIRELSRKHKLVLIGGDTNRGPLSISIQVIGENKKNILYRNGAKTNDDIYVTGKIGLARSSLIFSHKKMLIESKKFLKNLRRPVPRIDIGQEISEFATSCIDISDGLAKDLNIILQQSKKGALVEFDKIPSARAVLDKLDDKDLYEAVLGGGEDYELCFTANSRFRKRIKSISNKYKTKITKIGVICGKELIYTRKGKIIRPKIKGFDHFNA